MRTQHYFIAASICSAFFFLSCTNSGVNNAVVSGDTAKIAEVTDTLGVSVTSAIQEKEISVADTLKKKEEKKKNSQVLSTDTLQVFIVSFFSIGSGINSKARKEFDLFIAEFATKYQTPLNPKQRKWGREGEVDYCFELDGLKKELKTELIAQAKQNISEKKWVRININKPCKN